MVCFETCKIVFDGVDILLLLDGETKFGWLSDFLYLLDFNDTFFKNSKHVGDKANMVFSDVEPTEISKAWLETAFVILEDGLLGNFEILANYRWGRFLLHTNGSKGEISELG